MDSTRTYECIDCQDFGFIGSHWCNCEAADALKLECEAVDFIDNLARNRREAAARLSRLRRLVRSKPLDRETFPVVMENTYLRKAVYNHHKPPLKPTIENLACEAERYTLLGRAPLPWESNPNWYNPHSTEYYSACGYEDYLGDQREQAREYAELLVAAVDHLIERW